MTLPLVVKMTVDAGNSYNLSVDSNLQELTLENETQIIASIYGDYQGIYEVTPGDEAVTLETTDLVLHQNIVVNPIPSNYGVIGWNGSYLTVS